MIQPTRYREVVLTSCHNNLSFDTTSLKVGENEKVGMMSSDSPLVQLSFTSLPGTVSTVWLPSSRSDLSR
jgi:hypothetical protein